MIEFDSLMSKPQTNDPYQPMINAFHSFLIRNDPVKSDREREGGVNDILGRSC